MQWIEGESPRWIVLLVLPFPTILIEPRLFMGITEAGSKPRWIGSLALIPGGAWAVPDPLRSPSSPEAARSLSQAALPRVVEQDEDERGEGAQEE